VNDGLEGRVRDNSLVEGVLLRDVLDDGEVELVLAVLGVSLLDLVGLLLGADGGDDAVAVLEQDVEDVGGDEAGATCEQYAGHVCACGAEPVFLELVGWNESNESV